MKGVYWSLLFLLSSIHLVAQVPLMRNLTVGDGLPSSFVYRAFQDSEGYMWFCTDKGVARYDGYKFEVFTSQNGLPYNDVFGLIEDRNKRLWFTSYAYAFSYYDIATHQMKVVPNTVTPATSEHTWGIVSFASGATHMVLSDLSGVVVTQQNEVLPARSDSLLQRHYFLGPVFSPRSFNKSTSIYENSSFLTLGGRPLVPPADNMNRHAIATFLYYPYGTYYCTDTQLFLWDGDRLVSKSVADLSRFGNDRIIRLSKIGASRHILVITEKGHFVIDERLNRVTEFDFIAEFKVNSLTLDRDNNLWIATKDRGIFLLPRKQYKAWMYPELTDVSVKAIATDKSGRLWLGSSQGDVYVLEDRQLHKITLNIHYRLPVKKLFLTNNELFITWEDYLSAIIPLNQIRNYTVPAVQEQDVRTADMQVILIRAEAGKPCVFRWKNIKDICQDYTGNIYLSTPNHVYRLTALPDAREIRFIPETGRVLALAADRQNTVWVGAPSGLSMIRDNQANRLPVHTARHAITQKPISAIVTDLLGGVWVATDGYGLYKLMANRVQTIPELTGASIKSLSYDQGQQRLFVLTNRSVYVITNRAGGDGYTLKELTPDDGLPAHEIQCVAYVDTFLYAGTDKGLLRFNPALYINQQTRTDLPLYIRGIEVNNRDTAVADRLELTHRQNTIRFNFIALSYHNAKQVQYEYRMLTDNGFFDAHWHPVNGQLFKEFQNLPPGEYQFFLRASDPDGNKTQRKAPLTLVIQPPWWQTSWVVIFSAVLLMAGLYYGVRWYTSRKLLHQRNVLKWTLLAQEEERKRLAADLHDDLGATLAAIRVQLESFQQPASLLSGSIKMMDKALRDLRFISHNLMPPEFSQLGLAEAIHDAVSRLERVSGREVVFVSYGDEQRLSAEVELTVYRIAVELINNAVKHANCRVINVQLIFFPNRLTLMVEDDGNGYIKPDSGIKSGIGDRTIRSRAKFLNAKLQVDSGARGTTVSLEVPV
ncbi:hypothetical protein GCM10023189_41630 [Nibrella saemangeumensis]|uniref:Histidine kinase domain-containing protein n=1 Tax=Nibrella saemangeumensis TaxID=1084526 RepID=A0ABP8NB62_9BACT